MPKSEKPSNISLCRWSPQPPDVSEAENAIGGYKPATKRFLSWVSALEIKQVPRRRMWIVLFRQRKIKSRQTCYFAYNWFF